MPLAFSNSKSIVACFALALVGSLADRALGQVDQQGGRTQNTLESTNTQTTPNNANNPATPLPQSAANLAAQSQVTSSLGLSFANTQALTISEISNTNSPLAALGLQVGDQISALNGHALGGNPGHLLSELLNAARNGQPASLTITRDGQPQTLNLSQPMLRSIAQSRGQSGSSTNSSTNPANAGNQQNGLQTTANGSQARTAGQNTIGSAADGNTGALGTGSALANGAGSLNLNASGTGTVNGTTNGTTGNTDQSAAINAIAGFQNQNANSATVGVNGTTQTNSGVAVQQNTTQPNNGQMLGLTFANTPGNSLTITGISPNSPLAGILQVGDRIGGVDGSTVTNPPNLMNQLAMAARGDQAASLSIIRNGVQQTVSVPNSVMRQIGQNQSMNTPRLAGRPTNPQSQNANTNQAQNALSAQAQTANNPNAAQLQNGTPNATTGPASNAAANAGPANESQNNLPTTVLTPSGPRIVTPGQERGQGRGGQAGAGLPAGKGNSLEGKATGRGDASGRGNAAGRAGGAAAGAGAGAPAGGS